ncbi:MAG: hypothetical protein SPJ65_14865 [Roseburia sp.]|nr:hypothetical protein [Roseburia sp.]
MRVISQDGTIDTPYEEVLITLGCSGDKREYHINGHLIYQEGSSSVKIATYSTEEKAKKSMEMLRIAHENNELYHHTSNSEHFTEFTKALSEEMFKKATTEYFQFPTEEELE